MRGAERDRQWERGGQGDGQKGGNRETGKVRRCGEEKGKVQRGRQREPESERQSGNPASRPLDFEGWVRATPRFPLLPTPPS